MLFKTMVVFLLYINLQVKAISEDEFERFYKKCSKEHPNWRGRGSAVKAEFALCFLTGTKVLDSDGEINKQNLGELLRMFYKNADLVENVVNVCAIKQNSPLRTAYFVFDACWFDPTKELKQVELAINLRECLMLSTTNFEITDSLKTDAMKCFNKKRGVINEAGEVNKTQLTELLKVFDQGPSVVDSVKNCIEEKNDKSRIIEYLNQCMDEYMKPQFE